MLIPVLIVSSLVHVYSIGYMSHDPHVQRFFSYLSLFTFMMIILVTGNNLLLMFVGWEGSQIQIICPKWLIQSDDSVLNFMLLMHTYDQKRSFFSNKLKSSQRIGPHNVNVISLIIGSLLSNSYLEKRGYGIRIVFIKCNNNVEYLMWFHSVLSNAGYCNKEKPKLYKLIDKGNKVLFIYSFKSYSFSSFIWLYNMFYKDNMKIIPRNLDKFLTPLALVTLFLSSARLKKELPITIISVDDLKYLSLLLKKKYNINTVINDSSLNISKYSNASLHIKNSSVSTFSNLIKPHLLHSQYHLLNKPLLKLTFPGCHGIHNYSYFSKRDFSTKKDISDIKYTLKYKIEYILSLEQKEALIGIILGDEYLEKAKPNHNTRLRIEQSYPEKEKYLKSLYELLEPLTTMSPTILTKNNKHRGTTTVSQYFRTLAMPCLNYYYDLFYKEKVKIVPRNLDQLLTARGLAYWIMDDGGKSVHNQTILHTRAFMLEDVKYLQSVLFENFGLVTRLEEKKQDQWVIYIPVRQKTRLKDIVGPYMQESMLYKI